MAGSRQPVVDRGANPAAFERRFALALMPRDQQQYPVSGGNRALQSAIDRLPCPIEAVAMQIQRPVGLDPARSKSPVPTPVERRTLQGCSGLRRWSCRRWLRNPRFWPGYCRCRRDWRGRWHLNRLARKRPDRCRDSSPKLGFLRGQAAHEPPYPWAAESAPGPWRTCRRRFAWPRRRRPRRCRSDLRL